MIHRMSFRPDREGAVSASKAAALTMVGPTAMSEKVFTRLGRFIEAECGIKMPPSKRSMLESRLRKRLKALGMSSFEEYCNLVFSSDGMAGEVTHMIDAVTTNKTDFFRESAQFDFLEKNALPELVERCGCGATAPLKIWSAGCATGEEPYSIAMVVADFARQRENLAFSIMATDISTRVLEEGKRGVYREEKTAPVSKERRKRYLMRNRDRNLGLVRIVPELRSYVNFRRLNFMDEDLRLPEPQDIIFCRNVIIYFERSTQAALMRKFIDVLTPGGYLFVGHSETLQSLQVPLIPIAPSTYRKPLES